MDFHIHVDHSSLNAVPLSKRLVLIRVPKNPRHQTIRNLLLSRLKSSSNLNCWIRTRTKLTDLSLTLILTSFPPMATDYLVLKLFKNSIDVVFDGLEPNSKNAKRTAW